MLLLMIPWKIYIFFIFLALPAAGDHGYESHNYKKWSAYVSKFDKTFVGFPEYAHEIM